MTFPAGTRVEHRGKTGTAQKLQGLAHRTLVMWDERPATVQFVDDDLLTVVVAEQEVLAL